MKLFRNLALFAAFLPAVALVAQVDTSTLNGTVMDTSSAAVPGASIVVKNIATGAERMTKSTGNGTYAIHDLPIGSYNLSVKVAGFGDYKTSFVASVGGNATVDIKMEIQSQDVQVDVSAADAGAEVNLTSQEISQVITPLQLTQLPSVTRNPYDFVQLSGNITSDPNGSTTRGVGVSFSGGRAASTEILLDGVENVDLFGQGVGVFVPLDSVQEYRVITSGFDAQYGRASGGIVNLITKGGSNQYHGSGYEFNRISALASHTYYEDATSAFCNIPANGCTAPPADHFTQNQFGYSVGGPVLPKLRDKLFFFSNTEWNRVRSAGSTPFLIPSPAFIGTTAASTQAYFAQYGKLASGVTVEPLPSGVNPDLELVSASAPVNAGAGNPTNEWFTSNRVDYHISDKTTAFFRYGSYKDNIFPGTNSLSPYDGFNTGSTDYDQTAVASVDHIFTPNLISSTKFQVSRINGGQPLGPAGVVPGLYLYNQNGAQQDVGDPNVPIVLPGYLPTSPGNAIPFAGPQNLYQIQGDVSYVLKAHTVHLGGGFIQVRDNRTFGAYLNAVEFAGATADGEAGGLAGLASGNLYNYQVAIDPGGKYPCVGGVVTASCSLTLPVGPPSFTHENTFNDGDWYVSDSWKASPRLTMSLGLRWEYYGVQHDTKPNLDTNFYPATGGNLYTNIENGVVEPATSSPVGALYAKNLRNYAPRIGFAYDLTGDGKTSLRGGYGLAYERNFGNVGFNTLFNPPNYGVVDLTSNLNAPQLSISTNNYAALQGAAGSTVPLPPVELRALDPHIKTAYAHSYSLSVEREVMTNTLVQLSYTGTRGIHQYSIANENKIYSGAVYLGETNADGSPSTNALNQQYASINVREANADSYYNGANLRVVANNYEKYGLQFTLNYTLAHALDNLSSTFSESLNNDNLGYTNPFIPSLDRGNADFDVRHRITFGGIYEAKHLPFVPHNSLTNTLLGGLEFAPLYTWRSGNAFTVLNCYNGLYSCVRILDAPGIQFKGAKSTVNSQCGAFDCFNYGNPIPASADNNYVDPIVGVDDFPTFGPNGEYQTVGMGKDQFYGPHNWDLDMGVYKNFRVKERYDLQIRSEFYNLPNHSNFYANAAESALFMPGTFQIAALKGTQNGYSPSPIDERRFVQLAVKLTF